MTEETVCRKAAGGMPAEAEKIEELKRQIEEKKQEIKDIETKIKLLEEGTFEEDEKFNEELNEEFDEMIRETEGDVKICGLTYDPVTILKQLDPTGYRILLLDFIDAKSSEMHYELNELKDELKELEDELHALISRCREQKRER